VAIKAAITMLDTKLDEVVEMKPHTEKLDNSITGLETDQSLYDLRFSKVKNKLLYFSLQANSEFKTQFDQNYCYYCPCQLIKKLRLCL